MDYLIYESAITSVATDIKKNSNIVEFITVLQEADVKNRNGRIYPKPVIDAAIHSPIVQDNLRKKCLFGEAGHPFSQDMARQTTIDLRNIAFRVNELWWEGNLLKGRCETTNTALGRDMAGLIESGCKLSFSMRGQGNVVRDPARNALVVQSPLALICWDWVWVPSHEPAYIDSICEETKTSMFNRTGMTMSLNESLNLYENGSMTAINPEEKVTKVVVDYVTPYGFNFKSLNETYVYDKNDKVNEINNNFVLLENDNQIKKVTTEDYLLKSIRNAITECCANIAPTDNFAMNVTKDLNKDDSATPEVGNINILGTITTGSDVNPAVDDGYENPVEKSVKDTIPEAKNVSASVEALKEEFHKIYHLIAEETRLSESADILKTGLKYTDFMSPACADLFRELAKEDK